MNSKQFIRDVLAPFLVGMIALSVIMAVILAGWPEWLLWVPMPAVFWGQWKLAPFLFLRR